MKKKYFSLIFCFLIFNVTTAQLLFSEEAEIQGIDTPCGATPFGSGIAIYDYNQDGWDDITMGTEAGLPVRFFKNINGSFIEDPDISILDYNYRVKQINWIDIDNDGDKDLFLTSNENSNKLYENNGDLVFSDITVSSGLPIQDIKTWGATWGDYNNDGFLDLFLCNRDLSAQPIPNYLYRNNGDNTFTDVSVSTGISPNPELSLCAAFLDINNDGWQDIYVSNDKTHTRNTLYKNDGAGNFIDITESSNTDLYFDAMTVTVDDYNNDGWFDIYVTNGPEGNALLKNNGDETFDDVTEESGTLFNSVGWGAQFFDADNDLDMDLYVSGSVYTINENLLSAAFYENLGNGSFEIPENIGFENDLAPSYSNAKGDLNNDGLIDIVVNNMLNQDPYLWKNHSNTNNISNNWLKIRLEGVESNRDGIGSRIELALNDGTKLYRYTHCGEGYLSQNSATEHYGLADNTAIDYVKITWLSGIVDVISNPQLNQVLDVLEGTSTLSNNEFNTSDNSINLYPNPTNNLLTILSSNGVIEKVVFMDIAGKIIFEEVETNTLKYKIDLNALSKGIYLAKVFSNNSMSIHKIIRD